MNSVIPDIQEYFTTQFNVSTFLWFVALSVGGSLVIGLFNRAVLGKRSDVNHAVSSAMGILCVYALTVAITTFNPANLSRFLTPLPFLTFSNDNIILFSFTEAATPVICSQVLSMIILAFLVNLLDTFIPKGNHFIGWYLYRFLTVIIAMVLHYVVTWLFNHYMPGILVIYAPMILLGILSFFLLLGFSKMILGLLLTAVDPILGGIYAFFFSHMIGKQLTKAVLTTILLCALVYVAEYLGYAVINIASAALIAYIPLILIFLVVWYLLGHIL